MKRFIKWVLISVIMLVILAGAGAAILIYYTGREGSSTVEKWIASQLQTIANSYLNPQLSFDDLDYEYPGTVKLKNLRLIADDPQNPGKPIEILGTADATVTLGEVPAIGKPIVIQKISLNQPLFQAVATAPGAKTFVGFSGMVKQGVIKEAAEPKSVTRTKLSQVFQMRLVELVDGKIVYNPRIKDTEPMVLDQINTRMDVVPGEGGEYALKLVLNRKPVFDFDIDMKLNIDTMYASGVRINLTANLGDSNRSYLPPQVQRFLADHDVRGDMFVRIRGEMPLTEYQKGNVLATVQLSDANVKLGEYRLPVEQLDLQAKFADGRLLLPVFNVKALRGELTAGGEVKLNDAQDCILALQVANMQLEDLFTNPEDANDPKLAGRLNAGVNVVVPLAAVIPRLGKPAPATHPVMASAAAPPPLPPKWGEGTVTLDHARLVKLPVIGEITQLVAGGKKTVSKTESADAVFSFGGDKLRFSEFRYLGDLVAARGNGTMSLDQKLDLVVNAGPIEKVQSMLGKNLGDAIGKVTDRLISYVVTGPLDKPEVRAQVGDGVVRKVGKGAVDSIGEGAKDLGKGAGELFKGLFGKD